MTTSLAPIQTTTTSPEPALAKPTSSRSTSVAELGCLLIAVAVVIYWNSLPGQFVFDDVLQIVNNPRIRQLWPLADWQRPVGYLTFQWNHALGGLRPQGYHLLNILIHCVNGLLVFGLARRLLESARPETKSVGPSRVAFAIALLWLVHPLNTSAVTITVQRLESLMALWFLLCLYAVVRAATSDRPWHWQAVAIGAMLLGVLTKEVMITCLPVILLFDRAFLADSWRQIWRERRWFYSLLTLPLGWIAITSRLVDPAEYSAGFAYREITPWEYLRSQPMVLLHYLRLTFWPEQLIIDYGWPVETSPWRIYLPGLAIVALLLTSLWLMVRHPRVGCLALAAFIVLGPSSSIMPIADLCFEHRMYLPLVSIVALVVLSADWLLRRAFSEQLAPRIGGILLVTVTVALGYRTIQRNHDFIDPIRLWEHNVALRPAHARPRLLLAMLYDRAGRTADAGREFQAAVAAKPNYVKGLLNLGTWSIRQGNYAAAAAAFARAVELEPELAAGHGQLGRSRLEIGDLPGARQALERALGLSPRDPVALRAQAWLLATSPNADERDPQAALDLLGRLPADPQQQDAWRLDILAAIQAEQGDFDEAIRTQELAMARATEQKRPDAFASQLQRHCNYYRVGQPWRIEAATNDSP